jgi:hypothetical protein
MSDLREMVEIAVNQYNRAREEAGLSMADDDIWWDDDIYDADSDFVYVNWSITWNYGGFASGQCQIPAAAVDPETRDATISRLITEEVAERDAKRREANLALERRERAEYERLKAKYESPGRSPTSD